MPKKNFKELRKDVRSDPERAKRVENYKRASRDAMRLAELRESLDKTQQDLAEVMDVSQANVSQIEHSENLYLSTLAGYVGAMGGRLEINVVFDDRVVPLAMIEEQRRRQVGA
jgi:DNA-binding XRE family transcriptional regulator